MPGDATISTIYYVKIDDERFGPFDAVKLKQMANEGQIARFDSVSRDGETNWVAAHKVKGLFSPQPNPAVVQFASSEGGDRIQQGDPPDRDVRELLDVATASSPKRSLWEKAKETLGDVSTHAAKVATLSSAGVEKTAALGKQTLEAAGDVTRGAIEASKQAYSGSKLESAVDYLDGELEQRGAKRAIKGTTEAVVGKLDQVTGKRLVELLEEKLRVQDAYNDILATRLAEALDRIAKLEARSNDD